MERINQFHLYELAKELSLFLNLSADEDLPTNTVFWPMWRAQNALSDLLHRNNPCELGISRTKCQAALVALNSIQRDHFTKEDPDTGSTRLKFPEDGDEPVGGWAVRHAIEEIGKFETVFAEELREEATYRVPQRGIFHIPKLVDLAHESFPVDLRAHIPEKANVEWRAVGRCMAFNLLSASGFHVARAVEAVMQSYYHHFTGQDPTKPKTWHEYLTDLDAIASKDPAELASPSTKTVIELKQMKDDYRNPIMHPRIVLEEADARMLFANGEAAIIAMASEMKQRFGHVGPPQAKGKKSASALAAAAKITP